MKNNVIRIFFSVLCILGISGAGHSASVTEAEPTVRGVILNPTSLDFGDQLIGTTSASKSVTLTVDSTGLEISSTDISGDFDISRNYCNSWSHPGTICDIEINFTPTALGRRTGTLTITSDSPSSPDTVALSGNGISETPPKPSARPIPTLSEWAMILLVLMLAGIGFLFGRSRLD